MIEKADLTGQIVSGPKDLVMHIISAYGKENLNNRLDLLEIDEDGEIISHSAFGVSDFDSIASDTSISVEILRAQNTGNSLVPVFCGVSAASEPEVVNLREWIEKYNLNTLDAVWVKLFDGEEHVRAASLMCDDEACCPLEGWEIKEMNQETLTMYNNVCRNLTYHDLTVDVIGEMADYFKINKNVRDAVIKDFLEDDNLDNFIKWWNSNSKAISQLSNEQKYSMLNVIAAATLLKGDVDTAYQASALANKYWDQGSPSALVNLIIKGVMGIKEKYPNNYEERLPDLSNIFTKSLEDVDREKLFTSATATSD